MSRRLITLLLPVALLLVLPASRAPCQPAAAVDDSTGLRVRTDRQAWESIGAMDLAKLEERLEEGWQRIHTLVEASGEPLRRLPENDEVARVLWDQIYYRLSAMAGNAYLDRLRYAERVIYPDVAGQQFAALELSIDRLDRLVRLVGTCPDCRVFRAIDPLASALVPDYQLAVASFRGRLALRKKAVMARLGSVPPPGIVDVASLLKDPLFAGNLVEHQERLENPIAMPPEACRRLAAFDPDDVTRLVACADTVADRASATFLLDAAKFRLAALEGSLDEARRAVVRLMADPYPSGDVDYLELMQALTAMARPYHDPAVLEGLYGIGQRIGQVERRVARRPFARPAAARPGRPGAEFGTAR